MPVIDPTTFDELKQISGAEFINELIDTFLDDAPRLFDELKSGLAEGNADSFRRAAHSLKSNAATVWRESTGGVGESVGGDRAGEPAGGNGRQAERPE